MKVLFEVFAAFIVFVVLICVVGMILGLPIMWLWNALCPELFHLPAITFWQALGLYFLSSWLFKAGGVTKGK